MKSRAVGIILVLTIITVFAACSSNQNSSNSNTNSDSNVSTNSTSSNASESTSSALTKAESATQAYVSVLQNNIEFLSTDSDKKVLLNDFLTNGEVYKTTFKVSRFAVLDMDGDESPEIVLELTANNSPEFYEILHYMNGAVYGYNEVARGLGVLKKDGSFFYSGGAMDNGCGIFTFNANSADIYALGNMSSDKTNVTTTVSYFINDKPVMEDVYGAFIAKQKSKEDVTWYEFSQDNINSKISFK